MKLFRSRFNILNTGGAGTIKIRCLCVDQFGNPKFLPRGCGRDSGLGLIDHQRNSMLAASHRFIDRFDAGFDIQSATHFVNPASDRVGVYHH